MHVTYHRTARTIDAVAMLAVLFVCLDALTTTFALYGIAGAAEANPLVATAISSLGVIPTMGLKLAIGAAFTMWLAHCAEHGYPFRWMQRDWRFRRTPRIATTQRAFRMLVVMAGLHGLVVINNTIVIITRS